MIEKYYFISNLWVAVLAIPVAAPLLAVLTGLSRRCPALGLSICLAVNALLGLWGWVRYVPLVTGGRETLGLAADGGCRYTFNLLILSPCAALAAMLVMTLLARLIHRRCFEDAAAPSGDQASALDRTMIWLLALFICWAAFSGIWELSVWLRARALALDIGSLEPTGGLMAVLALLFVWLREWLKKEPWKEGRIGWLDRLKPYAPILLANGLVVVFFLLSALVILEHGLVDAVRPSVGILLTPLGVTLAALFLFDPSKVGMHAFYRSQLAACYLRAGRLGPAAAQARPAGSGSRCRQPSGGGPADDLPLADVADGRPLHLICCAANHLQGDLIDNLHRGARSAVLSRHGIAIGDRWVPDSAMGNTPLGWNRFHISSDDGKKSAQTPCIERRTRG